MTQKSDLSASQARSEAPCPPPSHSPSHAPSHAPAPAGSAAGLSEALLARAVAMSDIAVWHRDLATDIVHGNEHLFRILGLPFAPGGIPFSQVLALQHPEDRAKAASLNKAVLAGDAPLESRLRYLLADGRVVHLLSRRSLQRDAAGRAQALLGVTLDITEWQNTASQLRDARERAALAVSGAGIGTWEWYAQGNVARWDDNMFHLRGLAPRAQALTHEERMALVHPEDRQRVEAATSRPGAAGEPVSIEFRIVRPDGQVRWLASRSVDLPDAVTGELRRIGANWDVTDRREAEQTRREAEAATREAELALRESQAKSRFTARMSHELRTPLNAVLGFAQLLLAETPDGSAADAARRRSLEHIRHAGQHLLTLVNDVLDLARVEGGEMTLARTPVPLAALVSRTLPLVQLRAQESGVRLPAGLGGEADAAVLGDETRLAQVLLNLLDNAIKYNRAGGEVQLRARTEGALVHLSVHDTGRGIAPARLAELFQPFNRLGAEAEAIEGSGIGLALVKAFVEHMGGSVHASSTLGAGSVFEVVLPRAHGAPNATHPAAVPDISEHSGASARPVRERHVLYIEDNAVNALLVREVLARMPGYRLSVAESGAAGLSEAARSPAPDLVLLDMHLPDMDGLTVLRQLRASPRTAALPVVALSANAMPDQVAQAMAAGLTAYWTKPLDLARFAREVAQLLA